MGTIILDKLIKHGKSDTKYLKLLKTKQFRQNISKNVIIVILLSRNIKCKIQI